MSTDTPTPHQIKMFLADRLEASPSNDRVARDLLELLVGESGQVQAQTRLLAEVLVGEMRRGGVRHNMPKKRAVVNLPRRTDIVPIKKTKHWLVDDDGRIPTQDEE